MQMKSNIIILLTLTAFIIQCAFTTNLIQSEYFIILGRHLLLVEIPELNEMLYKTINQQTEYSYLPIDTSSSQLTPQCFTISFPNITTSLTVNTFPSSQTYPIYPSGLSFVKSYSSLSKPFSIIHSLYDTNQISSLKYAFEPLNPNKGIFYVGGLPLSRVQTKHKSTLLPYNVTSPYWNSIINAIHYTSITNEPLSYGHGTAINEEVIFNVGLPYIAVPPSYFQFVYKHIFHNAIAQHKCSLTNSSSEYELATITCTSLDIDLLTSLPKYITFVISNINFPFQMQTLFEYTTSPIYKQTATFQLMQNTNNTWIFGGPFFTNYISLFDMETSTIHLYSSMPLPSLSTPTVPSPSSSSLRLSLLYITTLLLLIIIILLLVLLLIYSPMEDNTVQYDELFEYKKLNAKLEDALEQKNSELTSMTKLYQELKSLNERSRRECDELNAKLIKSYTERSLIEKKYEAALEQERANLTKQSEIYKDKILKLSSYDPQSMKAKLENEVDLKYRHILSQKQLELDSLTQTVSEIKRNYDLLQTEYEAFKSDALKEHAAQRALHQNEINDLLHKIEIQNEKVINNIDKETFRELKNELDASRKHVNDLTNELDVLRNEKEKIIIERNELKLANISELDKEKFNNKHLQSENDKQSAMLLQLQNENDLLKQKLNDKSAQLNELIRDKSDLVKRVYESDNEFQMFKGEILALRSQLENRDRELADNMEQTHNEHKERLYKEIADKENYQQQIQNLTNELKDVRVSFKNYHEEKDKEVQNLERDYVILQEEKRIMLQQHDKLVNDVKLLQSNYEIKANQADEYEREYLSIQAQYRNVTEQMKQLNKKISELEGKNSDKDKQMNALRSKIDGMKYTTDDRAYADLMRKYKEVLEKKKYYKKQCKITNNNILAIMNKVTPEQKREIEEMAGGLNALLNPAASQSQSEA